MARRELIRVASIPANHPYIRHIAPVEGSATGGGGVTRLADPPPNVPDPLPGQWWPPVMLEHEWVTAHHRDFDLAHLHFGFDAAAPDSLRRWVEELGRHGRPLVLTVHDLVNPHFIDQHSHAVHLDVLIPAATEIITLTAAAAAIIKDRWGRTAEVIPHPHVVPLGELPALPRSNPGREITIGLHAKSLRANVDPLPVLTALDAGLRAWQAATPDPPGIRVRVDLHPDVWSRTDSGAVALRQWLQHRANDSDWQVIVHPMFTDAELWSYLGALDLYVLPYRFGTHSGWLEACVDVGTGVLVPDVGCYAEQHQHPSYPRSTNGSVEATAFAGVLDVVLRDPARGVRDRPDRTAQRRLIAAAHERVYRRALDQQRQRITA